MVMAVVVVVVGHSAVVVDILVPVLLVQWELTGLGLVGVVVAVVLWVDHQRSVQVCLHITTSLSWVGHLREGNRVAVGAVSILDISQRVRSSSESHKTHDLA